MNGKPLFILLFILLICLDIADLIIFKLEYFVIDDALCVKRKRITCFYWRVVYIGTFEYMINDKPYINETTVDLFSKRGGSYSCPKEGTRTRIFVNKKNFNKIYPYTDITYILIAVGIRLLLIELFILI